MKVFKFCINNDCTNACEAKSENDAWLWLSKTKQMTLETIKKLYTIKQVK